MQATPELLIYLNKKLAYRFLIATRTVRTACNRPELSPFALGKVLEHTAEQVDIQSYFRGKRTTVALPRVIKILRTTSYQSESEKKQELKAVRVFRSIVTDLQVGPE